MLGILRKEKPKSALIFTNMKRTAERVSRRLKENGIANDYISGDLPQNQRLHIIDAIKAGETEILVATDVAARGLHIEDLDMVINYDLPEDNQDYVHRIGRTARAGASGTAISFLAAEQASELREIELMLGETLPCRDLEGFAYMQRLVPSPDRTAKKPKPRLVYNGSARRRHR